MSQDLTQVAHGGDLAEATRRFGVPAAGWLDLSTCINPTPYPLPEISPGAWTQLPQSGAWTELLDAARACYGAPPDSAIVAAPSTQALIHLLPRLRARCRVAIIDTTYAEHAEAWRAGGHGVSEAKSPGDIGAAEICIAVNPNNPDGHLTSPEVLQSLIETMARRGGWLIVDEAFADVAPGISVAGLAGRRGLIILRSFGKFFGLAGLRLGFALTDAATAAAIRHALGPWAVSGPAMEIATKALADRDWIRGMRQHLAAAAARFDRLLSGHGLDVIGGTTLYRLVETTHAGALHHGLAPRGILTRAFDRKPDWLRIGLPDGEEGFRRLTAALGEIGAETPAKTPRRVGGNIG